MSLRRYSGALALVVALAFGGAGCAALQELASLRRVDFAIDGISNASLAGISSSRLSAGGVSASDLARIAIAVQQGNLPLSFDLVLGADNPSENAQARLLAMDWTLFVENRETISGVFNREVALPPGQTVSIPISMNLELTRFFNENARDMVDLAMGILGVGGEPREIRLVARPSIQTALGPIRYPEPITIVRRDVGSR